jgi:hypothetical protein
MSSPCNVKTLARLDHELTPHGLAMRTRHDSREQRAALEGNIANSAMYAFDAYADDVATSDDVGTYYHKSTTVESGLSNYEGGMDI